MSSSSNTVGRTSPQGLARTAGVLYLITIVLGAFAIMTRRAFIVSGDPSATAAQILASESLFRLTFAAELIAAASYLGVTVLLYVLLRPVNRSLSLLAAFFSLTGTSIGEANLASGLTPLHLLKDASYASAMTPEQLQALAYAALQQQTTGFMLSLVFFGLYCLSLGYLIIRSKFLPGLVGLLLAIAGLTYLVSTSSHFLSFPIPDVLYSYMNYPPLIGEGALMLWLVVVGLNASKWEEQVRNNSN